MSSNVAPVVTNYDHVSPIRPWQASARDRLITAGIFLGSLALAYLVIKITGLSGKLGFFASFLFIFTTINAIRDYLRFGSASAKDSLVNTLVAAGAFITIVPITSILYTVISKGIKGIYPALFVRDMSLNAPNDPLNVGGLGHSIVGTILLT